MKVRYRHFHRERRDRHFCARDMTIMVGLGTARLSGETYEGIVDGAFEESTFRSAPYFTPPDRWHVEDAQ
ncbi:MAG: hypothetical protein ACLUI3_03625 [Christensenellales bacterium]